MIATGHFPCRRHASAGLHLYALAVLAAVLGFLPFDTHARTQTCFVVSIHSGDTLTARCGDAASASAWRRVRLQGIEAPKPGQPFAEQARQKMHDMVRLKPADVDCDAPTSHARERICRVMVTPDSAPNGPRTLDAGLALLTVGLARWQPAQAQRLSPQERGQYEFAEEEAKAKRAGLWKDARPTRP
ncbi:endonuclease YncB(thermonuclease family) [Variovorax boronicumulans]|uniref:thermonuclease family protein n=1 Tax=Variovorax boronicumulans TaxID=436515 RepID=UPI00278A1937|nr:thermonuclease family protein [Variovorax boronicumulans]MDP9911178.1 endonuclease YncB(thermonuclease family) [Variovorax boronicumulans]